MAVNPVTDAYMYQLLKRIYKPGVTNNKVQGSPTLNKMKRTAWEGGESLQYATQYGNGGDVGASFGTIVANPSTIGAQNAQWSMNQGHLAAIEWLLIPFPTLSWRGSPGGFMMLNRNLHSHAALVLKVSLFGATLSLRVFLLFLLPPLPSCPFLALFPSLFFPPSLPSFFLVSFFSLFFFCIEFFFF